MAIQIDTAKLENNDDRSVVFVLPTPEYQVGEPQIGVMGVSFPRVPTLKRAMTTSIFAFGSTTVESEAVKSLDLKINLIFPADPEESENLSAAERYVQLRKEIVESGLPLLNDEELRQEIRERKGVKTESEA
jgi:hypothetical protein